jgi:outer membrane receptor protein involved in Fe transport
MHRLLIACMVWWCIALPCSGVRAQTDADEADEQSSPSDQQADDLQVETSVDAGESIQVPEMPSGFTTRLTPDQTFTEGDDLADLLQSAAGVTIQRRAGPGHPAYLSLRGGNPRQTTIILNGVRISAPAGLGFDVGTLSTTWIDSLEVRRGASAIVDGSGALTGSLHLTAHAPSAPGQRAVGQALGGSFGTAGLSGTVSSAQPTNTSSNTDTSDSPVISAEISGGVRTSRGDFDFVDNQGTTLTRLNNDVASLNMVAATHGEWDRTTVDTAVIVESTERGAPGPSEFQRRFRRARIQNRRAIATAQWASRGVWSSDWGIADIEAHAGYVDRSLDYTNPESFLSGEPVRNETDWRSFSAGGQTSLLFDAGVISHLTLDTRWSTYTAEYSNPSYDRIDTDRQTVGLGLSNEILLADEQVSLVGALRAEVITGDRRAVPVMPAAGVIWRATPWLTAKTNVAYSHRIPDFDELYLRTGAVEGNPDLRAERSLGWDAGLVADAQDFPVSGGITWFQNDIFRSIRFLPVSAYKVRAINLDGARSHGLEAFAKANVKRRWQLHGSYTWTRAVLDALPDEQLVHQPQHRARLDTTVNLGDLTPFDRLQSVQLSASGHYRSRVNLDNFGNLTNPPYWRLDIGASVSPEPWFRLGINVRNLTDYRRGADTLQRPLPGRAIYGSLRLRQNWQ